VRRDMAPILPPLLVVGRGNGGAGHGSG